VIMSTPQASSGSGNSTRSIQAAPTMPKSKEYARNF
jgi:hypothetical protein